MDQIITLLGKTITRVKYERQPKFRVRANHEFRESVKKLYKHDFKGQQETAAVLSYPFCDMDGYKIFDQQYDLRRVKKEGIIYLYKTLKIKVI